MNDWRSIIKGTVLLTVLAGGIWACGSKHPPEGGGGGGVASQADTNLCLHAGDTRDCHIIVSQDAGFANCMAGTQTCNGTNWSACGAGGPRGTIYGRQLLSTIPHGVGGAPHGMISNGGAGDPGASQQLHILDDPMLATPMATLCTADPCDPYCYGWDDTGSAGAVGETQNIPQGSYGTLPGGAKVNGGMCKTNAGMGESDCQYDTCCTHNGNGACVQFGTSTSGRCQVDNSTWGDVGQTGGGDCQGKIDYTALIACDDMAGDTHVGICNVGGVNDTANQLYVGMHGGGNPKAYPFQSNPPGCPANSGCILDFSLIPGGLSSATCGDLDMTAGTWNGSVTGVDCSSMGANPALRAACFTGNDPILLNGGGGPGMFGATNDKDVHVPECNSANNWSFYVHGNACINPPPPPVGLANFLTAPNQGACTLGAPNTQADADKCQYDTCCSAALTCVDWSVGGVAAGGMCDPTMNTLPALGGNSIGACATQPDYTVTHACIGQGPHTDRHVNVCNRGGAASPLVGNLNVGFGNNNSNDTYNFSAAASCIIDLSTFGGLGPQVCGDLDTVAGTIVVPSNGGTSYPVNCNSLGANPGARQTFWDYKDRAIYINGNPNSTGDTNVALAECDGGNNFSHRSIGENCGATAPPPPPPPTSFTYTGACSTPGTHVRWKWASYLLGGGAGDVKMVVTTQAADPQTGMLGPSSAPVTIADPPIAPTYTQCDYVTHPPPAVPPCPLNLGDPTYPNTTPLLGANATDDVLTVTFSYGGSAIASKFGISYDCLPYE